MKRILAFLNLLEFLLIFIIPYAGFSQQMQKVSIEIYKELENGQTTKQDTLINLEDLDKVAHLMGPRDLESLRTAIFLAEGGETHIVSKKENGIKTLQIAQFEGDDWENLDEATKRKVKEAYRVANIPKVEEDQASSPTNREMSNEKELRKVTWDGKRARTTNLSGQKVEIDRQDLNLSEEQTLTKAMNTQEVGSLLAEMDVEISLKGERSETPVKRVYVIQDLSPEEKELFIQSDPPLELQQIKLIPSYLRSSYLLLIELAEESGEMELTLKDSLGKVHMQETHLPSKGTYVKELDLGASQQNGVLYLSLTQNDKVTHKRIFAFIENSMGPN